MDSSDQQTKALLHEHDDPSPARTTNTSGFLVKLTIIASLGGFLFGYDTGVISGALLYIGYDFPLTNLTKELIVSGTVFGAIIGAGLAGPLSNRQGRKRVLLLGDVVFICGAILMCAAPVLWLLIVGRVVVGIGIGLASMIVPMYLSEVAPIEYRGVVVTVNVMMITFGQFISYAFDAAFATVPGTWRWMVGVSLIPAICQLIGMEFMPESPRWYLFKEREEEALEAWQRIRPDSQRGGEFQTMKNEALSQREIETTVKWSTVWTDSGIRRSLFVGSMLQLFQQFAGINTVMYYSPTIIQMTGLGGGGNQAAVYSSMVVAGGNALMTVAAMPIIDRFGRRVLLLVSLFGTCLALLILALSFILNDPVMSLCGLFFYTLAFAPGMGPVPWAINAEIYPLSVRERCNSIATMVNWASNLVMSLTFLSISSALSPAGAFLIYAIICILAFAFVLILVPETRSRSIEQILWFFKNPSVDPPIYHEPFDCCRLTPDSPYIPHERQSLQALN